MYRRRFSFLLSALAGNMLASGQSAIADDKANVQSSGDSGQPNSATAIDPSLQPSVQAETFLCSLSQGQRSQAALAFDTEDRTAWHFIPKALRKGLPLLDMDQGQASTALRLLKACISSEGFTAATQIMELESLIGRLEGDKAWTDRNPKKYYFSVFGVPGTDQRWGLSVEGHHLSLNFVFQGDAIIDSTPQFFGANPARVQTDYDGFPKDFEVLPAEQQLALSLVQGLNDKQLLKALLPGDPPPDIHTAGSPQPTIEPLTTGISAKDMSQPQQEVLRRLLDAYNAKMHSSVAKQRWDLIDQAGFDQIHFAWSGGLNVGQKHYYRIQGPTFLVEFINVQTDPVGNPANHIHCVWRDMTGDFDLPFK